MTRVYIRGKSGLMNYRLQVQQPFSYKGRTEEQREPLRRVAGLGRIFSWDRRVVFVSLASMPSWGSAVPGLGEIATCRLGGGGPRTGGDCHGPVGNRRSQDGRLMADGGPKSGRI